MVLNVRAALIFAATLALGNQPQNADVHPNFEDYPARVEQIRKAAPVRLATRETRRYATQLREAAHNPPDFAGHYVLANWGCGASCLVAAAIDAKTGAVTFLPFTVSNWPLSVTEPLTYKSSSRLLLVQGSRDEKGNGTSAYEFTGHAFRSLTLDHSTR